MPKVLPEYLELRRQQILDAAASCFARRGFHQSTMQDICEEAGLSPGAVYRYFRSKDEIIEAMCQRGQSENLEIIQGTMAEGGGTLQVIDKLIDIFFGALAEELKSPELCALNVEVISEAPRNPRIRETLSRSNGEVLKSLTELVTAAQAKGEIDSSLAPMSVAEAMFALYQGFVTQKLVEPDIDVWRYADVLRAFFHGTFWQGDRPAPAATVVGAARPRALSH
jgi:AcrR family transcriptional regulator